MSPDDDHSKEPGTPLPEVDSDGRILTLIADKGNRRLLREWIEGNGQYEHVTYEGLSSAEFDCLICDREPLLRNETDLVDRKTQEQIFTPYVLLVDANEERQIRTDLRRTRPDLWQSIDAVVAMPVAEHMLADRIATLFRLRAQSREVVAQRKQMEILNRVLRHDIRNDLNVVLGWADILSSYVVEEGTEYLDRITRAGRHIVELTEIAKDVAEDIQTGETADLEPISLEPLLREEVQKRRDTFDRASIEIEEPLDSGLRVWANPMLSSVFRNLINNAVFHNDSARPHVTIDATVDERTVTVRVSDNGPGIPDDLKDRIFEEARKGLDSSGTGMGLFLVSSLVASYQGDVWIEDNDPRGSTFVVELRLVDDAS